jgi:transcriptional regulator with XRE-family HTH domain
VADDLAALRRIPGALERARRAHLAIPQLEQIRKDAIAEARDGGETQAAIGAELGISRQAISKLLQGGPGPERAFWGAADGKLTIAVGGKTEAPKMAAGQPGPVVAVEDFAAFEMLRGSVQELGISAKREVIGANGFVNLNRPGLVVICGPRLSPMVGQLLASDRNLGFACDDTACWYLKDRKTGCAYRSPMDEGDASDIAYLGRLPRPDGMGTFLYMAGIHAPGAAGAVHYLANELDEVWQQVRDRRFSALIRCQFDPATRDVITSERITDFYGPA